MLDKLSHKKSLPSAVITVMIVAMLIVSGPAQAVQVRVNANELDNRQVGETGAFYIDIIVGANERVPMANISVEGLPEINGSPDGTLVFNVSDFNSVGDYIVRGNYNITLVKRYGWVSGYGYGYGYEDNSGVPPYYGYGDEHQFFGYGYGYGYGYGDGSADTYTELKYKVTVDTDGADPGEYEVEVKVNTGQDVIFEGSTSFTLASTQDITPPSIRVVYPGNIKEGSFAQLNIKITDDNPDTYKVFKNGTLVSIGNYTSQGTFKVGIDTTQATLWNYTVWANDTFGNENSETHMVEVLGKVGKAEIIPAAVEIKPETLNLASKGKFTAFITLPEGYDVYDIDISTVECEGAHALKGEVSDKNGGTLKVKFNRQDLVDVPTGNAVTLWVTGQVLSNGDVIDFEGSDTIRVIDKGKGKYKVNDEEDEDECECEGDDEEDECDDDECDDDECDDDSDEDECDDEDHKNKDHNENKKKYVYEYEYEYVHIYEYSNEKTNEKHVSEKKSNNKDNKEDKSKGMKKGNKGKK